MRTIGRILLILIALILLIGTIAWSLDQRNTRPVYAGLGWSDALDAPQTVTLGDFAVNWNDGVLGVHHPLYPDLVSWQSVEGRAFVGAAIGEATITESRGMFTVDDERIATCGTQVLDAISADADAIQLTGTLDCDGELEPYTLTFDLPLPDQLRFTLEMDDARYNRLFLTYASDVDEQFFGFGEQFSYVNMKGRRLPIMVSEQGIGRGAQPITAGADIQAGAGGKWHSSYAGVPHYITSEMRSLFLENYGYSVFDLRDRSRVQVEVHEPTMVGRILVGDTPAAQIENYTQFAGRMRALPAWVTSGAIVGMQGGTDKVRDVWAQMQAFDVPLAGFWLQDWVGQRTTTFGKQLWWNWELDRERYPNWEQLVSDLAADDVNVMVYVNPFLADVSEKPNARRNLFQEAATQGYLVTEPSGEPYMILNTSFTAGLLDLTNPDAVAWMEQVLQDEVLSTGALGWMADFGEALPTDGILHSGESAETYHNRYPEAWSELNRRVVDAQPNGDDIVFFSRSGFTRSPRSTTLFWLGDQLVTWDRHDGIKTAVTGLLSSGFSGYAFNHSDIGGYTTIENPLSYVRSEELLLRWMELNAFTTVFRSHEGNIPDANVQVYSNARTLQHFADFAHIYQAWGFYRDALVAEAAATGLPVVRHPFIHYPTDVAMFDLTSEQFLVGSEILVAPVLSEGADSVEVTLPTPASGSERWVHVWSGVVYESGETVRVDAPLGQPGVFVKEEGAVSAEFLANLRAAGLIE